MDDIGVVSKIVKLPSKVALVHLNCAHLVHTILVWISQDAFLNAGLNEYT